MTWIAANTGLLWDYLLAHLALSLPPILLTGLLALPLGRLIHSAGRARSGLITAFGLIYTIPSLPLFIILPLIIGTGIRDPLNLIIALTLYGLALQVPATAEAVKDIDPVILDAASGQGFSRFGRALRVELPLAAAALIDGLRIVSASTIALVTVGAVLGIRSLGSLFTDGFQRGITAEILAGIILTLLLAGLVDALLVGCSRWVRRWRA